MKRARHLIPAALFGLLAGWILSVWLMPERESRRTALRAAPMPATHDPLRGSRGEWNAMLNARTASIANPKDADDFIDRGMAVLANSVLSPGRRKLEFELLRHSLPDALLTITIAVRWPSPEGNTAGMEELWSRVAKQDVGSALETVDLLFEYGTGPFSNVRDLSIAADYYRTILREWLRQDPQTALAALAGSPASYNRGLKLKALVDEWSQLDPAAASAALSLLPEGGPGFQKRNFAETIFRAWHQSSPSAAREWANGQRDAALQKSLTALDAELSAKGPAEYRESGKAK